ncbi:Voltage-dependent anion-selective channel protein 1 [Orobanche minor]
MNLFTTITVDEPTPGLKAILSFRVPDQRSGKLELQYLHEYAGISSSVGLTANPIVNFSGVLGSDKLAFGSDLSFDTKEGAFTKCNFGASFTNDDLIAALTLDGPIKIMKVNTTARIEGQEHEVYIEKDRDQWTTDDRKRANLDNVAKNALFVTLDKGTFSKVKSCKTAKEIRDKLKHICEGTELSKENKII